MDRLKLGRNLFAARKKRKMTAEDLAKKMGISASFIRQIECGRRSPSLSLLIDLCNELEITPNKVLAGDLHIKQMSERNRIPELWLHEPQEFRKAFAGELTKKN